MKNNKIIICGFSGIGKTVAQDHCDTEIKLRNALNKYNDKELETNKRIIDLESSGWSRLYEDDIYIGRNPKFPNNYINDLISMIVTDVGDIFLLSCHQEVRDELKARGLKYIIVLPYRDKELKNEYKKRWLKRGSDIDFITKMNEHWDEMIDSCVNDEAPKIYLDKNEYLSDILV